MDASACPGGTRVGDDRKVALRDPHGAVTGLIGVIHDITPRKQAEEAMRQARDATLAMPALLLPSVQVNMRAGHFPPAEANGVQYLKIPLNAL